MRISNGSDRHLLVTQEIRIIRQDHPGGVYPQEFPAENFLDYDNHDAVAREVGSQDHLWYAVLGL